MSKRSNVVVVASVSLAIALLSAAYVSLKPSPQPSGTSPEDKISEENLQQLQERGPVGEVKALLFEIGNKAKFEDDDIQCLLTAARDPKALTQRLPRGPRNTAKHNWTEVDIQSTRFIAIFEISEGLRQKKVAAGGLHDALENALVSYLTDRHPHVRLAAVNCLGRLGMVSRPEIRKQVESLTTDPDVKVRDMAYRALEYATLEESGSAN